jgi:hypothetical protein
MSGNQLTGTLTGTLSGKQYLRLEVSGELRINEQTVPVTLQGTTWMNDGQLQPTPTIRVLNAEFLTSDSGECMLARFVISESGGEYLTTSRSELFDGIETGSFILERGAEAEDGSLPITMIFQNSSTVEINRIEGEFEFEAKILDGFLCLRQHVEIKLINRHERQNHAVWLEAKFSENSLQGMLRFESDQGELGVSLENGRHTGAGGMEIQWRQDWATGIFRGTKSGGLTLSVTPVNIKKCKLEFILS